VSDSVLYEITDGVATITLNRPDAMNALVVPMKAQLLVALERAGHDDAVRAVLLTGAGRAFCAGQDLREHADNLEAGRGLNDTVRAHYNPIVRMLTELNKPVLAAVNGVAAGAGAALAFACDLRIAADTAKFAMAFNAIGLSPDTGASWSLSRLVGSARATELMFLGEPVDAARALDLGLVSRVDLRKAAHELAVRLAQGPTQAFAATKRALLFAASHPLDEVLELEAELQDVCAGTADHLAATRAFLAKEPPTFTGR
jgi:2-(1,2-epoxy-1,2-dihydrophenyl)acetyl-CoA isomerase